VIDRRVHRHTSEEARHAEHRGIVRYAIRRARQDLRRAPLCGRPRCPGRIIAPSDSLSQSQDTADCHRRATRVYSRAMGSTVEADRRDTRRGAKASVAARLKEELERLGHRVVGLARTGGRRSRRPRGSSRSRLMEATLLGSTHRDGAHDRHDQPVPVISSPPIRRGARPPHAGGGVVAYSHPWTRSCSSPMNRAGTLGEFDLRREGATRAKCRIRARRTRQEGADRAARRSEPSFSASWSASWTRVGACVTRPDDPRRGGFWPGRPSAAPSRKSSRVRGNLRPIGPPERQGRALRRRYGGHPASSSGCSA